MNLVHEVCHKQVQQSNFQMKVFLLMWLIFKMGVCKCKAFKLPESSTAHNPLHISKDLFI